MRKCKKKRGGGGAGIVSQMQSSILIIIGNLTIKESNDIQGQAQILFLSSDIEWIDGPR